MILLKWFLYTIIVSVFGWIVMIPLVIGMIIRRFIFGESNKK